MHGIRKPHEVGWFSSPWFFPTESQVLLQALVGIKAAAAKRVQSRCRRTAGRLFVMDLVKNAVKQKVIIN